MACGSNIQTVMVIGDISREIFNSLITKERVRVLHLNSSKTFIEENEQYKSLSGDLSNRIFLMALFLQYNFPIIISEEKLISDDLFTVCKEQWHGEYNTRSLIAVSEKEIVIDLTNDTISASSLPSQSITSQIDLLLK